VISILTSICVVLFLPLNSVATAAASDSGFLSVQLAVIEDADGFVNVRSRPDAKSDVVLQIQKDEFFACAPSESDWWRVKDFFNNEGYMHKSRIRLVKGLPGKTLERLFVNPPSVDYDELVDIHEVSEWHRSRRSGYPDKSPLILDGTLFRNTELNQCIFITHHTDGMIPLMVLFSSRNTPDEVFDELQIHTRDGDFASLESKKANLSDLLDKAASVPARHFETVKGLRLGEKVDKAIKIFGKPHNQRKGDGVTIYEWGFAGGYHYGLEYSESSLGFFDMDRVTENGELTKKPPLNRDQLLKIERYLQSPRGDEFIKGLLDWVLLRTRGSRVHLGFGYYVRLYVRDGKVIAIAYEWGIL